MMQAVLLAALLMTAWAWDPVTTDCSGGPETIAYYRGMVGRIIIVGEILNVDGEPTPIYRHVEPVEAWRTPETVIEYELPIPAPGEVTSMSIESTDTAGNGSEEACL